MASNTMPHLESYTLEQISEAASVCPAVEKYLHLIKSKSETFEDSLRIERHRSWLRSALSVFHKTQTPQETCFFWSQVALQLIKKTWAHHKLADEDLALFAVGKLGSLELNLSSDVDLLIVGSPMNPEEAQQKIKLFRKCLHESTHFGFALRVDFDLRPDGAWGPLIISIPHFQDHYWSRGETWERLALLRLLFITGQENIKNEVLDLATRFCFRKFLDFTLMEDLKNLRARIHAKSFRPNASPFDLKHGIGGIRDAELFVHSLQVIHGGRNPDLRNTSTTQAAVALASALPESSSELLRLAELYWRLRDFENQVQIVNDEQTHLLFENSRYPQGSSQTWTVFQLLTQEVNQIVSTLLGDIDVNRTQLPKEMDQQKDWLLKLGFSQNSADHIWPDIMKSSALSHRKDRDETVRQEFLFTFVCELSRQDLNKDLALAVFLDFVRSARAKSTLFTLILRNEKLLKKLALLFSHSPYMGQIIASRPELIDSFLYGQHELSVDTAETLQLLFEKRQLAEVHSALDFFEQKDPDLVSAHLTSTADQIAIELKSLVLNEIPGAEFEILCLGKWGSRELGFRSDLDFILVKNGAVEQIDHRAVRKFIHYMTSAQKGGRIYDIDMRLRPSGSSGPLLVGLENLVQYLKEAAVPWERQSYLRLRPLEPTRLQWDPAILYERALSGDDLAELKRIRQGLIKILDDTKIDIKYSPGGLIDLEFAVQIAALQKKIVSSEGATAHLLTSLGQQDSFWKTHLPALQEHYSYLRTLEQLLRLSTQSSSTILESKGDTNLRIASIMQVDQRHLFNEARTRMNAAEGILKHLDPIHRAD